MTEKYTLETIKDLKIKVKDLNGSLLSFYKKDRFKPDETFRLIMEQSDTDPISPEIIQNMCREFDSNDTEFEAGKTLYEHLEKLTPKQASDIGFWTYHNHHTFYPYIVKRWGDLWNPNKNKSNKSAYIINHWVQANSSQSELIDYPISGLWWSFYITIDETRKDKYELTKLLFENLSLRTKYFGQARFARHRPAILGALEFINENELDKSGLENNGIAIYKYINLLGGIRPLSYFDKDWFKDKLEKRFGDQLKKGESLFERPKQADLSIIDIQKDDTGDEKSEETKVYNRYFSLDKKTGNYIVSSSRDNDYSYCIGLDFKMENQFLVHFYKEGKIKKSLVNGNLSNKTIDRFKPYSNGKCPKLTLCDVQLINEPVLFGIAYKTRIGIFFKAMDEQDVSLFRIDNGNLRQEGKKVLYIDEPFVSSFKILPVSLINPLGTLVQGALGKGADISKSYYEERWKALKPHWPELFNETIKWCDG